MGFRSSDCKEVLVSEQKGLEILKYQDDDGSFLCTVSCGKKVWLKAELVLSVLRTTKGERCQALEIVRSSCAKHVIFL
jgi:hypothetical protein